MVERFIETGHPVFKGISALSRGILKRKGGRCTIHFNADSSNTELLFRTIHSANQLSIYGAVSSWCGEFGQRPNEKDPTAEKFAAKENEQLLKNVKPQEVNSLVQTPRNDNRASGNRLRESLQRFETLEKDTQFTIVCEDATFARRVCTGMSYTTIPDRDDGFGDRTPACREYTPPCENSSSRIYATIPRQTVIGPVLQVHIIRTLGINGIPINNDERTNLLGDDMHRENRYVDGVTSQRSRRQSHEY